MSFHRNFQETLTKIDLALAKFDGTEATNFQPMVEVSMISQMGDPKRVLVEGEGVHVTHAVDNHRVSTNLEGITSLGGQV